MDPFGASLATPVRPKSIPEGKKVTRSSPDEHRDPFFTDSRLIFCLSWLVFLPKTSPKHVSSHALRGCCFDTFYNDCFVICSRLLSNARCCEHAWDTVFYRVKRVVAMSVHVAFASRAARNPPSIRTPFLVDFQTKINRSPKKNDSHCDYRWKLVSKCSLG